MDQSPGVPAHSPVLHPFDALNDLDLLIAAKRAAAADPDTPPNVYTNDAMAAMQISIVARAVTRAVDGMGQKVGEANIDYVCDQLERVQEAAGRAILAMLNSRRQSIIDAALGDDDDDLPPTGDIPVLPLPTPPEGGAS